MTDTDTFSITVAEDAEINVEILFDILGEDYDVRITRDGEQALNSIKNDPPDLVLLDIIMPKMDGIAVCRQLKKFPGTKDIPIIFLTSKTDNASILEGFAAGAVDYILKPFNRAELLARVRTHLELCYARKKLEHLVIHDDLTGLYNTRYLYEALNRNILDHNARSSNLSVLFMDIDNFKQVVDTYGHLNGSEAIREVAQMIIATIPEAAYGVAYGGDEYVVVLPDHAKDDAIKVAQKIRSGMHQNRFLKTEGCDISLTTSCGIATFPEDGVDVKSLLAAADKTLFKIKETSKDAIGTAENTR